MTASSSLSPVPWRKIRAGWRPCCWVGTLLPALSGLFLAVASVDPVNSQGTQERTRVGLYESPPFVIHPDSLPGRRVGAFGGSMALEFGALRRYDLRVCAGIPEGVLALINGRIDTIEEDASVLEYYAHSNPQTGLSVAGPIFEPDRHGFTLKSEGDPTRHLSNRILARLEDGSIRALDTDHFGHDW